MLILLSPAKKQDFETKHPELNATKPATIKDTAVLVDALKPLSTSKIKTLMSVSDKIATLNHHRYQVFDTSTYNRNNAKQALYALRGDAYQALDADTLKPAAIDFLQDHLIILSGLYGYLRPLDLIQPYRLEMKIKLNNPKGKDLYEFWGEKIAKALDKKLETHKNKTIINLASGEYFKVVDGKTKAPVITIAFKEKKNGSYKTIGINAKRARGMMTRFIADKKIDTPAKLKKFTEGGYDFREDMSDASTFVFVR